VRQLAVFQSRPVSRLRYTQLGVLARPLTRGLGSPSIITKPEAKSPVRFVAGQQLEERVVGSRAREHGVRLEHRAILRAHGAAGGGGQSLSLGGGHLTLTQSSTLT
jgi:hypothetical protein